jgi:hypothetical protein
MMKSPSLVRIILCDYPSFLLFVIPVLAVCAYVFGTVFGYLPDLRLIATGERTIAAPDSLSLAAALAVAISLPLLARRVRLIFETFGSGRPVEGVIESVSFIKDRGRIEYSYEFNAQSYRSGNAVMKNKRTKRFSQGHPVTVYVNASEPTQAFLQELYL